MADVNYDTLTIQINADSKEATKNINALNRGLANLDKTAKNLDKDRIEEVKTLLLDIANIDFSSVSKGLQDVVSAFKSFQSKAFQNASKQKSPLSGAFTTKQGVGDFQNVLDGLDFSRIQDDVFDLSQSISFATANFGEMSFAISTLPTITIEDLVDSLTKTNDVVRGLQVNFENLKATIDKSAMSFETFVSTSLQELGLTYDQITQVLKSASTEKSTFNYEELDKVRQVLNSIGVEGWKVDEILGRLKLDTELLQKEAQKSKRSFTAMFINILRYRVVRKVIQMMYQALIDGLQRISQFDDRTNQAMSNIKSSLEYLKSSLGSAIAPIIQTLAPILSSLLDIVADLMNSIGHLFALIRGDKTFVKATKTIEDYANALKKTTTIGIDELNIIGEQQKEYYIVVDVKGGEEVINTLENISALILGISVIMSVDWKQAIATLIPKVNGLSASFKTLGLTIGGVFTTITSFIDIMTNGLDWKNMALLIGGVVASVIGLQMAFHNLNLTLMGGAIGSLLIVISAFVDMAKNGANAKNIILAVVGAIGVAFTTLAFLVKRSTDSIISSMALLKTAFISVSASLGTLVAGVMIFCGLFDKVKASWGNMNLWQKLASFIGLVVVAVGTLIATISAFLMRWDTFAIAVGAVAVGSALSIGAYTSAKDTPQFATGGFPEDGLFFANHNELVGTFDNGKTAVANNEQIIEGIKRGVKEAIRESGGNDVVINLDGYTLAKVVSKKQNNFGQNLVFGGNVNYGK